MYCSKCGTQISEGDIFCIHCGARIEAGEVNPAGTQGKGSKKNGVRKGKAGIIAMTAVLIVAACGAGFFFFQQAREVAAFSEKLTAFRDSCGEVQQGDLKSEYEQLVGKAESVISEKDRDAYAALEAEFEKFQTRLTEYSVKVNSYADRKAECAAMFDGYDLTAEQKQRYDALLAELDKGMADASVVQIEQALGDIDSFYQEWEGELVQAVDTYLKEENYENALGILQKNLAIIRDDSTVRESMEERQVEIYALWAEKLLAEGDYYGMISVLDEGVKVNGDVGFRESTIEKSRAALLENIHYYGDASKCNMTAEQAAAFARLIEDGLAGNFSFRGGYEDSLIEITSWREPFRVFDSGMGDFVEVDRFHVMLGDFAGDGIPYLYVYSSKSDMGESFEIYGWADEGAKLIFDTDVFKNFRIGYHLDEKDEYGIELSEVSYDPTRIYYETDEYGFSDGTVNLTCTTTEELRDDNYWHIIENGEEKLYTQEEYEALVEQAQTVHDHVQPYTCFYNIIPCTLEEMANCLNIYASLMRD